MSDRSDHLIERAAALLRIGGAEPSGGKRGNAAAASSLPPRQTPLRPPPPRPLVVTSPPERDAPMPQAGERDPARTAAPSRRTLPVARPRSVTDLRLTTPNAPIALGTLEQAGLIVARNARTRTTEEYRIVIGRVLRALREEAEDGAAPPSQAAPNAVMITSARPGEGKSFTTLNLAGSIAQNAGMSVLIVDVDAKQQSMSEQLGVEDACGFLDMVADPELAPDDLVIPTELPNLWMLPLGTRGEQLDGSLDPALQHRLMTTPIEALSERFPGSLILLDAPPCLSTSDPHTFAPAVGQVVMVVEAERTQRNEVEAALDLVRVCPMITMLLNKAKMKSSHRFGSYDYFGSYT